MLLRLLLPLALLLGSGRFFTASVAGGLTTGCQTTISIQCGKTPSAVFSSDGRLWLAFVQHEHVYVAFSDNKGLDFSRPVKANGHPEPIYSNGENRPKIALGPGGNIYISWTKKLSERFSGDIRYTRSTDGGRSFDPVQTINDDDLTSSHRFDELIVSPAGYVYLAWLDKRDKVTSDGHYSGSAVYFSVSRDRGQNFSANQKVVDHSCECCRLSMAPAENEAVALMWRHMFNTNTRDHAIAQLNPDGTSEKFSRASFDDWQVDACPHHGPDMGAAGNGIYHLAWFSNGNKNQGIYYGQYDLSKNKLLLSEAIDNRPGAAHPQVAVAGNSVYFLWKHFDGEKTQILLSTRETVAGAWTQARSIASTTGGSDHPLVVLGGKQVYLSWLTDDGYRLIPLDTQTSQ